MASNGYYNQGPPPQAHYGAPPPDQGYYQQGPPPQQVCIYLRCTHTCGEDEIERHGG